MAFIAQKLISASGGVQEETDADFNITTSLMHFDGSANGNNSTYIDSSSTSKTLTCSSNLAQGTFTPFSADDGKWSVEFPGGGTSTTSRLIYQLSQHYYFCFWYR